MPVCSCANAACLRTESSYFLQTRICKNNQMGRIGTPDKASTTSTTIHTNVAVCGATINRYVDGGLDVPGVSGVPDAHGVATEINPTCIYPV